MKLWPDGQSSLTMTHIDNSMSRLPEATGLQNPALTGSVIGLTFHSHRQYYWMFFSSNFYSLEFWL